MYKTMQKGAMYYSDPNSNTYVDETHAKNNLIPEKVPAWSSSISNVQHWWFLSLMRDALSRKTGGYGPWHVGQSQNPNVSMCMIEKIGIKHWQKLFSMLNSDGKKQKFRPDAVKGTIELPSTEEDNSSRDDDDDSYYPSFVILRDPLDRFLSAYIDKCVGTEHRTFEKHCEPNQIYNMENNNIDNPLIEGFTFDDDVDVDVDNADKKKKVTNLNEHKKKTMFAAYVDTMPLKWNLHFLPQSFFCDGLYRFIDKYDFVGMMDTSFYQHLNDLGEHYGGRFEETLKEVFKYPSTDDLNLNATTTTTAERANVGIETKASEKVKQYYTPRSLRKVLEYVSIDYVMLKMEIPKWAEEMLREDEMS
jgi:hypothetical protein